MNSKSWFSMKGLDNAEKPDEAQEVEICIYDEIGLWGITAKDFDGGTSYMTNEELGAYPRLLIYQFRNECIPQHIFDRITRGLTTVEQVREKFTLNNG